ncbi:hypothetical protein [Moraxella catarrhalis]|uniref:hypothetical protein n=1 Tax=Moraxella catarrhalis TaxID=480 RepID=UPI0007E36495|nr:hypothetical protein [Moraxella catarrhalis]OAV32438.1 hypothetical protein AO367_0032 [Moraxella catarrhalis]
MKIFAVTALAFVTLMLTACGHGHEKVHAVDRVEEAQAAALANAPKAEEVVFEDEGAPTMTTETAAADTSADAAAQEPVAQEDAQVADAEAAAEPAQAPAEAQTTN